MDETWNFKPHFYTMMASRHMPLWEFLRDFRREFKIKSCIAVGGGKGYSRWNFEDYLIIDINKKLDWYLSKKKIPHIVCDFKELDVSDLKGKYDLVTIFAVVEHAGDYMPFIRKALELEPKYILISFFNNLNRKEDKISNLTSHGQMEYRIAKFSIDELNKKLEKEGILDKCKIFKFSRKQLGKRMPRHTIYDDVLVIDNNNTESINERVDKLCLNL